MSENDPLQFPVDPGVLLYIAIDGIETACRAFWAEIDRYPSATMFDEYEERIKDKTLGDDEVLFRLRDDEDGMAIAEQRPWVDITMAGLRDATRWALTNYSHLFTYTVKKNVVVEIDYDGWGADAILQYATLKEVVYG